MMRLPPMPHLKNWSDTELSHWDELSDKLGDLQGSIGQGDAYQEALDQLLDMAKKREFHSLPSLLRNKVFARALTQLWLDDELNEHQLLSISLLERLAKMQIPRMGRATLINLVALFFNGFDALNERSNGNNQDFLNHLISILHKQLALLPSNGQEDIQDPLDQLKQNYSWLIAQDSPGKLLDYIRMHNLELDSCLFSMGMEGLDGGRFGDVCRAHYYLDTLKQLPVGANHDVFTELLKPSVNKAPFEEGQRIGHAALAILIDRADQSPGQVWQDFILNLAGDPRIASHADNYRQWWAPLGENRIEKVRGWLSREDLKLFLQALEQYGIDSGPSDLQRMFPARKQFLEGLHELGLVRSTRLMLGATAEYAVKKLLGKDLKTNYVTLKGMSDKAVIYLDCGDFCLVEGSHSFKLWVYMAPPSPKIYSYDTRELSHHDLIRRCPNDYSAKYPHYDYIGVTHSSGWQNKVFTFLAQQGISLDIEKLLEPDMYQAHIRKYGIPVVEQAKERVDIATRSPSLKPSEASLKRTALSRSFKDLV